MNKRQQLIESLIIKQEYKTIWKLDDLEMRVCRINRKSTQCPIELMQHKSATQQKFNQGWNAGNKKLNS